MKAQLIAILVTMTYSFVISFVLYKVIDAIVGMRVPEEDENVGLDLTQHRERAYTVLE